MGLIRKSLAVGSIGLVRGSSKKQRVAKASLQELQAQTELAQRQLELVQGAATGQLPLWATRPGQTATERYTEIQEMRKQGQITRSDVHAACKILIPQMTRERAR